MGGCTSLYAPKCRLSPELEQKVLGVFRKMDVDGSKSIDKGETVKFWKSNFAKVNTEAMYKAVDIDKNGEISEDEWLAFWVMVKRCGHNEQEIEDEVYSLLSQLDNLIDGGAWVYFDKVPTDANVLKKMMRKSRGSII